MRRSPTFLAVRWLLVLAILPMLVPPARAASGTERAALDALGRHFRARMEAHQGGLYRRLLARTDGAQGMINRDPSLRLMFVDHRGVPRFYATDNLNAAATVNTNDVWPGGTTGFGLSGAGTALGELGEWDAGGVLTTHQELAGRVTQVDTPSGLHSHSTHVAGTLIASGVLAAAKGMSFEGTLAAYDWNDDVTEMAAAAANGMLASNHSYGFATGWVFNIDGSGNWFWFGDTTVSAVEDYGFGYYDSTSVFWDQAALDAPNYLIVKSAGNDRNNFGPVQPDSHYVWDPGLEDFVWSMTVRNPDGGATGYECIPWHGTAKNILTVGAVADIPAGWSSPADVVITSFSSWGPTDDGRIKPDLVANGASLTSCTSTGNTSYSISSGTSMATPNTAGSLNLLSHHFRATHGGATPRAATMKAVLLHTANEAGSAPGPDYRFGWGLLDVAAAAELIADDATSRIIEERIANVISAPRFIPFAPGDYFDTDVFALQHPGGPLRVTIAWTDVPGAPVAPQVDSPAPMLVHDLDLRVEEVATATTHLPWVLDPTNPTAAATTGDNVRDNVEQVFVTSAPAGQYRVRVTCKGFRETHPEQEYSIVSSGDMLNLKYVGVAEGAPAASFAISGVTPNPTRAGARIDFTLAVRGAVAFDVLDLSGRRVRALERAVLEPGRHSVEWDGRSDRGGLLPAGIYFVRGVAGGEARVARVVRLD